MKKALFTTVIVLLALTTQAQFKVHDDGQVSIGSLTKNYGVQCHPLQYTSFRIQNNDSWSWVEISLSNINNQKHWIVANLYNTNNINNHTFFVTGAGNVYMNGNFRASDSRNQSECEPITGAGSVLDSITGIWYIPNDGGDESKTKERRIGLSAQEVKNILPEAVTADENGQLYVDYEALTVFLIEAVKEQRMEIKTLLKTMEENGITR